MANEYKIRTKNRDVFLRVQKGHFATMHSHTNYFIDVTTQKMRLSEAKAVAKELVSHYHANTIIDTILCIDGMEVIGTCVAEGLTQDHYLNMNAHQTIYIISPEFISGGQLIFRDNLVPMLSGKNVLVLAASVTTGKSALAAMDAINYYGGKVVGVASIFATVGECDGYPVYSIFDPNDLGDYQSYKPNRCPFCDEGKKIEALVNSYGYSAIN
ncbi:MAG: orotate phosphoribosyltransferase [Clostridia bacterium]|nr:orotate phosphoribosyltransferase [Clostridia bacterium]